jgi:NAD(P)-dependent dehydrogenase (short-subunit alcohol dehydrogenase family)
MHGSRMDGKVVLIIGAGRWPGPALTRAFVQEGAVVAANDLTPNLLDPLSSQVEGRTNQLKTYIADATRGMPLRAMLDEVLEDWEKIDVLVNNPRVMPEQPLITMDEWDWQRTIEMNLNGPFLVMQLAARIMREQGQGAVLNIVDTSSLVNSEGRSAYAASQAGLKVLSQSAAQELMAYNIGVYTLCLEHEVYPSPRNSSDDNFDLIPAENAGSALASLAVHLGSSTPGSQHVKTYSIRRDGVHPKPAAMWEESAGSKHLHD